jgi:hypothetical protein
MTRPVDPKLEPFTRDQVIALLGVYAAQVGSYTTLLWQVPALSLTAQSFLLTIALTKGNGTIAKLTAAGLSVVISASSYALMHDQRGHAINHGELAMRLSGKLGLGRLIDTSLQIDDGVPRTTDANYLWTWQHEGKGQLVTPRAGYMYAVWKGCMILFLLVDAGVICSVFLPVPAAASLPAAAGLAGLLYALRKLIAREAGRIWRTMTTRRRG